MFGEVDLEILNPRVMKKLFFSFCVLCLLSACSYDSEEALYDGALDCDTELMSFEADILPIVNGHCTSCHGGSAPSAGLLLENYDQIKVPANDMSTNGIINRIERAEGEVGLMPKNYRLSQCQINKIKAWVEQGTLNN